MRSWWRICRRITVALACLGWLLPAPPSSASDQTLAPGPRPALWDVRLDEQGTLQGQLIDGALRPLAERRVTLSQAGQTMAVVPTDDRGLFRVPLVRGGVYQLSVGAAAATIRVWTPQAAPPAAVQHLVLMDAPPVVRGQQPLSALLMNPLVIGAVIAAAVAIPLAVHHNHHESPSGS
jgi:hypothetical protein